jgi:hypothetical protein
MRNYNEVVKAQKNLLERATCLSNEANELLEIRPISKEIQKLAEMKIKELSIISGKTDALLWVLDDKKEKL